MTSPSLILALQCYPGDQDQALKLTRLICDIEPQMRTDVEFAIAARRGCNMFNTANIANVARKKFAKVHVIKGKGFAEGWPCGCNELWMETTQACSMMQREERTRATGVFTFEPDCAPISKTWISELVNVWQTAMSMGKECAGSFVKLPKPHVNGNAIFRIGLHLDYPILRDQDPHSGWDCTHGALLTRIGMDTELIAQRYKAGSITAMEMAEMHSDGAVLLHGVKDENIVELASNFIFSEGFTLSQLDAIDHRHVIHAYYEPVFEIEGRESERLIDIWINQWTAAGWKPVIIHEARAVRHPLYRAFSDAINALPTVNPPLYERACFMRWLAMANIGGGWMCDYDVMPLDMPSMTPSENLVLHQDHNPCPSLVSGSASEYERIVRMFMAYKPSDLDLAHKNGPHCSDQNILQQSPGAFETMQTVAQYGNSGWQNAAAVHFASQAMEGKSPRSTHIPEILKSLKSLKK